jgi:hypothetical protein
MRELMESVQSEPRVLLEVEKAGKLFRFQVKSVVNRWARKGVSFSYTTTYTDEYEMLWSNLGETSVGRTPLLYNNGKRMSYSTAIRKFFEATNAAEHLTFTQIQI